MAQFIFSVYEYLNIETTCTRRAPLSTRASRERLCTRMFLQQNILPFVASFFTVNYSAVRRRPTRK